MPFEVTLLNKRKPVEGGVDESPMLRVKVTPSADGTTSNGELIRFSDFITNGYVFSKQKMLSVSKQLLGEPVRNNNNKPEEAYFAASNEMIEALYNSSFIGDELKKSLTRTLNGLQSDGLPTSAKGKQR